MAACHNFAQSSKNCGRLWAAYAVSQNTIASYIPWGNLGCYYNTAGIGYSDQTIQLGTYDASLEQLEALNGQDVLVEVAC